jgi:hypothetical protein
VTAINEYDFEQQRETECNYLRTAVPKRLAELSEIMIGPKGSMEDWYANLLVKILQSVGRVCRDLLKATEDPEAVPAAAWNARNLVELWVWIRYCSASRNNAWQFHGDALRDMHGLVDSWTQMCKQIGADYGLETTMRNTLADIAHTSLGLESIDASYARVKEAAKEVGLDGWYGPVNTFLSKFAHPTAGLVVGIMHQAESLRGLQTTCIIHGVFAARQCVIDLERIILAPQ